MYFSSIKLRLDPKRSKKIKIMQKINLMLIGCGLHAENMYIPLVKESTSATLVSVVDLEDKKADIISFLDKQEVKPASLFFLKKASLLGNFELSENNKDELNKIVQDFQINAVIISTEPLSHKTYMEWALQNNLHILIDKPITVQEEASTNETQAIKILEDFESLVNLYEKKLIEKPGLVVSCVAQRRYHPAMQFMKDNMMDVYNKTNCPVSSMSLLHADGQFRLPKEINNERYHGYIEGYGKCSHSGYHFFDIFNWFTKDTLKEKHIDKAKIYADFYRPADFNNLIRTQDYQKVFGDNYSDYTKSQKEVETFPTGELDANISVTLMSGKLKVTMANIFLIHNSFSNRSWLEANKDLYKGNGRVKHESYIIEQGPFQSIHYHCYQGIPESDVSSEEQQVGPGTTLHSEVYIFRNHKLVGGKNFEKVNFGPETSEQIPWHNGHRFKARKDCFEEFLLGIEGKISSKNMLSNLISHREGTILMSGSYLSAAREYNNKDGIVYMPYYI